MAGSQAFAVSIKGMLGFQVGDIARGLNLARRPCPKIPWSLCQFDSAKRLIDVRRRHRRFPQYISVMISLQETPLESRVYRTCQWHTSTATYIMVYHTTASYPPYGRGINGPVSELLGSLACLQQPVAVPVVDHHLMRILRFREWLEKVRFSPCAMVVKFSP